MRGRSRVAVIGHRVWTDLFDGAESPEGLELKTDSERFTVIGVLKHRPSFRGEGPWQWDGRALLPDSTFQATFPPRSSSARSVDQVFVRLSGVEYLARRIEEVRKVVKATLLRRHHGVENFKVVGESEEDATASLRVAAPWRCVPADFQNPPKTPSASLSLA